MQAMLQSMGGEAGGPQMTPEMIKMASSMMGSMSPDDIARCELCVCCVCNGELHDGWNVARGPCEVCELCVLHLY